MLWVSLALWVVAQPPPPSPAPNPPPGGNLADLEFSLTRHQRQRYTADLEEIKKRGVLRVLTRNNSSAYFVVKGEERGFQYELAKAFADELGVRLQMVVPSSRADLIPALLKGEGDLIAAGMTYTADRAQKVHYTRPVASVPRVLATHKKLVKLLEGPADLPAFEIALAEGSTTHNDAKRVAQEHNVNLRTIELPNKTEMEEALDQLERGPLEATIVDRHLLLLAQRSGVPVVERLVMSEPVPKAWATHPKSRQLHDVANNFLDRSGKNGLMKILYDRYFEPAPKRAVARRDKSLRADVDGRISPYDELFKAAGQETGLDWRLLAALAHTESRFDAEAKSPFGAVGLMQVLPSTAKEVGVDHPEQPGENVRAGARYLKRLMALYQDVDDEPSRVRFALASYNAGPGHVADARNLAKLTGKDPNRWFGQTEKAMLLKKDRRWHEKTKLGYSRADETINYVSRIQTRYDVYSRHVDL
ncbi:MAG: transporter substrate-binding domain-containing protein [Deltaproteobacteria bacterium]|nr:transporter substrate-binding domain-containing protein [Deltaproteobacteria bacterium]